MKKIFLCTMLIAAFTVSPTTINAQAWERTSKVLSLGVGFSQFYHLDDYYYYGRNDNKNGYKLTTEQFNFQGEFGIHKYVGLGFTIGVGGRGALSNNYRGEFNIPAGMLCNFHFYQLISDNSKKNIHGDKMDIYAGINLGSGVAFTYYTNSNRVVPLAFGGTHVGIRYYISPKFGLNAEVGMGKSIVNAGFSFKL